MNLTYKYRLRPTNKQRHILYDILFQMQTVYNDALNERRWYWSRSRRTVAGVGNGCLKICRFVLIIVQSAV